MSLKKYSPHLQLTIHRPRQFILGLRLLSALIIGLIILSSDNTLLLFCVCACVVTLHVFSEYQLRSTAQQMIISEFTVSWAGGAFELQTLRILFGYFVVLTAQQGGLPILLSRDQLSCQDWREIVRYSKLS